MCKKMNTSVGHKIGTADSTFAHTGLRRRRRDDMKELSYFSINEETLPPPLSSSAK
jgi:hypothetical protein